MNRTYFWLVCARPVLPSPWFSASALGPQMCLLLFSSLSPFWFFWPTWSGIQFNIFRTVVPITTKQELLSIKCSLGTHAHIHVHVCVHAHLNTHLYKYIYAYLHTHVHLLIYTFICTNTPQCTHAYIHIFMHSLTHMHTCAYAQIYICMHMHVYTHSQKHMYIHMHVLNWFYRFRGSTGWEQASLEQKNTGIFLAVYKSRWI